VSAMAGTGVSWKRIAREIEKCVVLCANCHRRRHSLQRKAQRLAHAG
jgi:hypothetical protein